MTNELERVPWDAFPQPSWNEPGAIPAALRALESCERYDDYTAYNRVLYALGNNHAGTYFPVVLPAISFIAQILMSRSVAARLRALDIFVDLLGSFDPEPKYEVMVTPDGRIPLRRLLEAAVREHASVIERCRTSAECAREVELATEVLELLEDSAQNVE